MIIAIVLFFLFCLFRYNIAAAYVMYAHAFRSNPRLFFTMNSKVRRHNKTRAQSNKHILVLLDYDSARLIDHPLYDLESDVYGDH